ncbi:MAG TPA: hypothetical protein VHN38_04070, partial [Immundisolibacter sp.]|nr:hypothetical protein [Immundisolibacter sp.]
MPSPEATKTAGLPKRPLDALSVRSSGRHVAGFIIPCEGVSTMQTTLKLTALAGALALALGAGQASAKVETSTFGGFSLTGGELLLQVWDTATETGYTRDLGNNFKAMQTPEQVAAMAAGTTILSYTADANWATFLGGVNDLANLKWGLVVGENF